MCVPRTVSSFDPMHAKVLVVECHESGELGVKTPGATEGAGIRTPAVHRRDRCARGVEDEGGEKQAGGRLAAAERSSEVNEIARRMADPRHEDLENSSEWRSRCWILNKILNLIEERNCSV